MELPNGMIHAFCQWYKENARDLPWRHDRDPYHVWLSEIMLQQTRVEAVKGYYQRFLDALPDVEALARASEERIYKLWEGLGYYQRARRLHEAAKTIVYDKNGTFPRTYEGILALPGIGPYTAGAIASICFSLPKPAVDGNVLRLMARILNSDALVDGQAFKQEITIALEERMLAETKAGEPQDAVLSPGAFTQSLMEIGATLCLPKGSPHCSRCPAQDMCLARRYGRAEQLPLRREKKARKIEQRTVFILYRGIEPGQSFTHGELALRYREDAGLLASMWELPNVDGWLSPSEASAKATAWGVRPIVLEQVLERSHVFTHVQWQMRAYVILCSSAESGVETRSCDPFEESCTGHVAEKAASLRAEHGLIWTLPAQREEAYPLPTAFKLFFRDSANRGIEHKASSMV